MVVVVRTVSKQGDPAPLFHTLTSPYIQSYVQHRKIYTLIVILLNLVTNAACLFSSNYKCTQHRCARVNSNTSVYKVME